MNKCNEIIDNIVDKLIINFDKLERMLNEKDVEIDRLKYQNKLLKRELKAYKKVLDK